MRWVWEAAARAWHAVNAVGMLGQMLAVWDGPSSILRLPRPQRAQSPASACCCESLVGGHALGTAVSSKKRRTLEAMSEHLLCARGLPRVLVS